jgi:hypothetical protein
MAITSKFYDTAITESDWAKNRFGDARYGMVGANDWKVTAVAGADRTVSIAPGKGFGHGIADVSDTNVTIQLDPIGSGSRWDLIAMRRDWQPLAGGPSAFVKVTGSSAKGIPGTRVNDPGVQDDQPVYLVQVTAGDTNPTGFVDLRCWAANGGLVVADKLALDYLAVPGARVLLGGAEYRYIPDAEGDFFWEARETMFREWNALTTVTLSNSPGGSKAVSFPAGMFDVTPLVTATKQAGNGAKAVPYVTNITASGCTVGLYTGDGSILDQAIPVHIRAVQTSPGRAAGVNP